MQYTLKFLKKKDLHAHAQFAYFSAHAQSAQIDILHSRSIVGTYY